MVVPANNIDRLSEIAFIFVQSPRRTARNVVAIQPHLFPVLVQARLDVGWKIVASVDDHADFLGG